MKISEWSISSWCCNGVTQQCPLLVTISSNIGCVPSFKIDNNCVAATRGVFKSDSGAGQPIQALSPSRYGRDWLARSEVWNSNTFSHFWNYIGGQRPARDLSPSISGRVGTTSCNPAIRWKGFTYWHNWEQDSFHHFSSLWLNKSRGPTKGSDLENILTN